MPIIRMLGALALMLLLSVGTHPASGAALEQGSSDEAARTALLAYAREQNSTGFLVMQRGKILIEENWPAPAIMGFDIFVYGKTDNGQLLEDVASQQKSFVAALAAIAIDKQLLDMEKPVSAYLGKGWSKASTEQEAAIRVSDILTMSSGLDEKFGYEAPSGTRFFYNTPVYAISKKVLAEATKRSLEQITAEWLTGPLGMKHTQWRERPAALAGVGNNTALVTTPQDIAIFGQMILDGGLSRDAKRIITAKSVKAMFQPSCCNPAYGKLWWLNSGAFTVGVDRKRREGKIIDTAPEDMVVAMGFLERRLYIVPSLNLIVVRTGAAPKDKEFDRHLWEMLMPIASQSR